MIDLSFLTEEEQETILCVLQRDARLKKAEEERVKNLQRSGNDRRLLKYLSGDWFYETKSLRHQDRIHGCDIIRASIRPKHRPLTLLELSQILPEKPSFVASGNQEVFIPPELCGLFHQDPHNQSSYESSHEAPTSNLQSPTKQRLNPFNSETLAPNRPPGRSESTSSENKERPLDEEHAGHEEPLSPAEFPLSRATNLNPEPLKSIPEEATYTSTPFPIYQRTSPFHASQDCASQAPCSSPRGILKVLPHQDSLTPPRVVPQCPPDRDSAAEDAPPAGRDALEKQVRFCPAAGQGVPQQGAKEPWEHSLLDADQGSPSVENDAGERRPPPRQTQVTLCPKEISVLKPDVGPHQVPGDLSEHCHDRFPQVSIHLSTEQEAGKASYLEKGTEEEAPSQARSRQWFKMGAGDPIMSQPLVEAASDITPTTNDGSKKPLHTASPKPRSRLLWIFNKVESKDHDTKEEDSREEEIVDNSIKPQISQTAAICVPLDNQINPAWDDEEVKSPVPTEVRSLPLTAIQNSVIKDGVTSSVGTGSDPQQEPTESKEDVAKKVSNLKAFWESGPKLITTRDQAMKDNAKKTSAEASSHDSTGSMVENLPLGTESTRLCGPAQSDDETFPQEAKSSNLWMDVPKQDGTYRAHPILVNDETDESLAGSVKDFQENSPTGRETCSPLLPSQDQSSPPEDKPTEITDLKYFWEKDYSVPKIIVSKVKEASSSADHFSPDQSEEVYSSHPDLDEEAEDANVVSHTEPMIGKGFVTKSLGKLQSSKLSHESEFSPSHERPLSPRCQSPRSRDSSDDELRRSPSKTCHPKVLVRESSLPRGSGVEGSPLKTFSIDIALEPKDHKEEGKWPTPAPRQRTDPSHEAKATGSTGIPGEEIISRSPRLPPQDCEKQTPAGSSGMFATPTPLARSFIPDDYQHYLGSPEKAHLPPFEKEESTVDSSVNLSSPVPVLDTQSKPRRPLRRQAVTYGKDMIEGSHSRIRSWIAQNAGSSSDQDKTTSVRSDSRPRSGSYDDDDDCSPVRSALQPISMSKSLENLGVRSGKTSQVFTLLPVGAVAPSASLHPDSLEARRMSKSVPALQLEEVDSDGPFDTKPRRRTASVVSNLSLSSGLASMSSVSGSVTSINHGEGGDVEVQGSVQFAVNYVQKLGELQIFVVHCRDLAVAEPKKSRSDPYVKCYLVPDKTKLGKRKTSVKKRTLNPSYNEILRFKILMEVLKMQKLNISVWHNDTFGRNSFLGEINLDLSEWDFGNTQINEYTLTPRTSTPSQLPSPPAVRSQPAAAKRGQMRVALRYLPQLTHKKKTSKTETGEVQIWVKDCKDLPPARGVIIDPFVKCAVLPDTSKKSRQKTRVVKRTANPMFNHTMVYDGFRPEDLREACAEITVWDHDRLNNHIIGGIRLGLGTGKSYGAAVDWMESTGPETSLWEKMMSSDGEWVEDILPLRTFVVAKSMAK
ncbi:unnamed protein product [Merluccius merluccius]